VALNDRISTGGSPISAAAFDALVARHSAAVEAAAAREAAAGQALSHFEIVTALAFKHFQEQQVGTGMGGFSPSHVWGACLALPCIACSGGSSNSSSRCSMQL